MKIVVDANIVFSGLLNTKSKIGDILINSYGLLDFIARDFLRVEIRKHYDRLIRISGLTHEVIQEAEYKICKDITFISEEQISGVNWRAALELVKDIDEKDIHYVAFSMEFDSKIWSGDKKLISGLKGKRFANFLSTNELFDTRETIRKIRRSRK